MNHDAPPPRKSFVTPSLIPKGFDYNTVLIDNLSGLDSSSTAYRIYDDAVASWVREIFVSDGVNIPVIPSPPNNAFSNYKKLLETLGYLEACKGNSQDYSSLPLPMISVHRTGEEPRPQSSRGNLPISNLGPFQQPGSWGGYTRYPKAFWFDYSINIWALKKTHMAWMKQVFQLCFSSKIAYTKVNHGPFATKYTTAIHQESYEDASNYQRSETEELILRSVYKLRVEAWMWDLVLAAPHVLKATSDQDGVEGTVNFVPGGSQTGSLEPPFEFV